jgi:putative ABC transport system permease protein
MRWSASSPSRFQVPRVRRSTSGSAPRRSSSRSGRERSRACITRFGLVGGLVGAQVALAIVLLVGSGLLARTILALNEVDPGFVSADRLSFRLDLPAGRYTPERAAETFEVVTARLLSLPGVTEVATTSNLPLAGQPTSNSIWIASRGPEKGPKPEAERRIISPEYLRTLGVPLVRGRAFDRLDNADALPVMLVSRAAAESLWGDAEPIGDRVELNDRWWTVVGVVEDVRDRGLDAEVLSTVYVPVAQWPTGQRTFVVRAGREPSDLTPAVRAAVTEVDPDLPLRDVRPLDRVVADATAPQRRRASLVGGLSLLAALLALAGIFGVTNLSVTRRSRDIGIRLALGSSRAGIFRLVLGRTFRYVLYGAAAGVLAAVALTRLISSQLYGVTPADPVTFGAVILAMLATATAAAASPAYRATRVDPMETLREE